jgi:hypothetical protein
VNKLSSIASAFINIVYFFSVLPSKVSSVPYNVIDLPPMKKLGSIYNSALAYNVVGLSLADEQTDIP